MKYSCTDGTKCPCKDKINVCLLYTSALLFSLVFDGALLCNVISWLAVGGEPPSGDRWAVCQQRCSSWTVASDLRCGKYSYPSFTLQASETSGAAFFCDHSAMRRCGILFFVSIGKNTSWDQMVGLYRILFESKWKDPVSYTHLDVYKRQR